MNLRAEITKKK